MSEPRLYILMRTDMASMNPGKGMAQAAHAANTFTNRFDEYVRSSKGPDIPPYLAAYLAWQRTTNQGFGTTITLAVDGATMYKVVDSLMFAGFKTEIINDPTYPIRDGEVTHYLPVNTCAYVFVPDPDEAPESLQKLPLHP